MVKKSFWMEPYEARAIEELAREQDMTESALVRHLLHNSVPDMKKMFKKLQAEEK